MDNDADTVPVGDDWKSLPIGAWFFHDSPVCSERYSVQERTDGGCSIVCSTPYVHKNAEKDMREIAEAHNRAMQAPSASAVSADQARIVSLTAQRDLVREEVESLKAEVADLKAVLEERETWQKEAKARVASLEQALFRPYYTTAKSDGVCAICGHFVPSPENIALASSHHRNCAASALLADAKETK